MQAEFFADDLCALLPLDAMLHLSEAECIAFFASGGQQMPAAVVAAAHDSIGSAMAAALCDPSLAPPDIVHLLGIGTDPARAEFWRSSGSNLGFRVHLVTFVPGGYRSRDPSLTDNRLLATMQALRELPASALCAITDTYDVAVQRGAHEFVAEWLRVESAGFTVCFGAEDSPDDASVSAWAIREEVASADCTPLKGRARYVNGGFCAGRAEALIEMFEWTLRNTPQGRVSDQAGFSLFLKSRPHTTYFDSRYDFCFTSITVPPGRGLEWAHSPPSASFTTEMCWERRRLCEPTSTGGVAEAEDGASCWCAVHREFRTAPFFLHIPRIDLPWKAREWDECRRRLGRVTGGVGESMKMEFG